ncbi:hypothetical protein ANCCAN_02691 [Ancylostoma caninum]|uniref:START domain-containing protein n=1 Tax=Ancylostoma caninum TaxID=29170 RepID=A0A368H3G7_ANCCA|nr:hypothetical protein ANCCAN_02691 [Ancylostoma caninum]
MDSLDAVAVGDEAIKDLLALVDGGEEGWKKLWTDDGIIFHTRKGAEPCLVDIIREENNVEFKMYFQCDLNASAPALVQKLMDKARPKLMCDKAKSLRHAMKKIHVDPAHLEKW